MGGERLQARWEDEDALSGLLVVVCFPCTARDFRFITMAEDAAENVVHNMTTISFLVCP